jgi:hypothetical protein
MHLTATQALNNTYGDVLPVEFLGFVFLGRSAAPESRKYILQNLTNVDIVEGRIVCDGYAFLNPTISLEPALPNRLVGTAMSQCAAKTTG